MSRAARPITPSGIAARALTELEEEARFIPNLPLAFLQKLATAVTLTTGLDAYVGRCTTAESRELTDLAQATASEDWSARFADGDTDLALEQEMLSGHLEGQFLKMLVKATNTRRVLEIGVFTGYSALAIAEALPDGGILVACEIDPFAAEFAKRWFAKSIHGNKIRVEVAPAGETLARLAKAGEQFDFVFIDADKGGYLDYLDTLLTSEMLSPNALICVDNTLMQGEPYTGAAPTNNGLAIANFNRLVAADDRVEQVLLPIRDGITLIRRVDR